VAWYCATVLSCIVIRAMKKKEKKRSKTSVVGALSFHSRPHRLFGNWRLKRPLFCGSRW